MRASTCLPSRRRCRLKCDCAYCATRLKISSAATSDLDPQCSSAVQKGSTKRYLLRTVSFSISGASSGLNKWSEVLLSLSIAPAFVGTMISKMAHRIRQIKDFTPCHWSILYQRSQSVCHLKDHIIARYTSCWRLPLLLHMHRGHHNTMAGNSHVHCTLQTCW